MTTCEQKPSCPNPAAFKMFWPGQPPTHVCATHATKARAVAGAMGFPLTMEAVPLDDFEGLTQRLTMLNRQLDEAAEAMKGATAAIERVRNLWPHIEIARAGHVLDHCAPACLRCKVEKAIRGE